MTTAETIIILGTLLIAWAIRTRIRRDPWRRLKRDVQRGIVNRRVR